MLRRIFFTILGVIFIILSLPIIGFASDNDSATPAAAPKKVEYALPYPGILPDNPLYSLKMGRDRIVGWFIKDSLKSAEYNLLQADKRLNSGLFLMKENKTSLAITTFSKGEKYLIIALDEAEKAQKSGKNTDALMSKLSLATLKHHEVLAEVIEKSSDSTRDGLKTALEDSQKSIDRVRSIHKYKLESWLQEKQKGKNLIPVRAEAKEKQGRGK